MSPTGSAGLCPSCGFVPSYRENASVSTLLRTNATPPHPQQLETAISAASIELGRYDDAIQHLHRRAQSLQTERDELARHVAAYRSVFSPIRRLPDELLLLILEIVVSEDQPRHRSSHGNWQQSMALLAGAHIHRLAGVCPRWHGIIMNAPSVWDTIAFNTLGLYRRKSSVERCSSELQTVLSRSAQRPLTIQICNMDESIDACEHRYMATLLQLVAQHSERWSDVSLELYFMADLPASLMRSWRNCVPRLQSLTLYGSTICKTEWSTFEGFRNAPALRSLSFRGDLNDLPTQIPWDQITSLEYTPAFWDFGLRDCLLLAPPLQALAPGALFKVFAVLRNMEGSDGPIDPIQSQIGTLDLFINVDDEIPRARRYPVSRILNFFTTPRLTELVLLTRHGQLDDADLTGFAVRSGLGASLTQLSISAIISDTTLLTLLPILPSLQGLAVADRLTHAVVTDRLLEGLTAVQGEGDCVLAPQLRRAKFVTNMEFQMPLLYAFVDQRTASRPQGVFTLTISSKSIRWMMKENLFAELEERYKDSERVEIDITKYDRLAI
ncbi:F-box domain-containing protein [Mycena indigotica]|uniref:F-box domain-containing protein n=1 Tax=Mycena indigotica TaxID=2126181 RepID=A0A8H6SDF5_9AGAR|nr:F-box domain-containing protein [Mycena indigotica]KAF7297500.1 F-box domain-containing protein [Mycena indigotica]